MEAISEIQKAASRRARLRSVAGEISDLYCDVVFQTSRVEDLTAKGATEEGIALARLAQKEALAALGHATERLMKMTGG